ncbi:DUF3284 domain-containing protein [Granulicatella seriolae]|uniref:DUF3284 domain-containing protein n=1 Tax=Granulicatella seriolae TaxID=2967226 RepID=A0ABT1WRM5_9LACT|nr:DUF3284 domain-containing protein [Granulicatella seriolae]
MQVSHVLQAEASQIYKALLTSIQAQVQASLGQDIRIEDIQEGLSYQLGNQGGTGQKSSARLTIVSLIPNQEYSYQVASNRGLITTTFDMKERTDKTTEVTYSEEFSSQDFFVRLNHKLLSFLMGSRYRKCANMLLNNLETYTLEQIQ